MRSSATALYLFQNKHGVVEELLEFFIGVIDAELLKRIHLKDFKACNIQNSNERCSFTLRSVHGFVDPHYNPLEHSLVKRLGYSFNGELRLQNKNDTKQANNNGFVSFQTCHSLLILYKSFPQKVHVINVTTG